MMRARTTFALASMSKNANLVSSFSGNQLKHLDASALASRTPHLHALQLGAGNPWRCDCRLRKLVRHLVHPSTSHASTMLQQRAQLLDEPICGGGDGESSRAWHSMSK